MPRLSSPLAFAAISWAACLPVATVAIAGTEAAAKPGAAAAFTVPAGFAVDRLFVVPQEELGSWVCLATDPKGRIIASDQRGQGLVRITPAPLDGSVLSIVEKIPADISGAQGLLWAFDALYVVCGNHTKLPFAVKDVTPPQTMGGIRPNQRYVGGESTAAVDARAATGGAERKLRRDLEALHLRAKDPAAAVAQALPHLASPDRFIRYPARVAFEHQPIELWQEKALATKEPHGTIAAAIGVASQAEPTAQPAVLAASTESLMPRDLLDQLNESEVPDLVAYTLSRGIKHGPRFQKN